MNVQTSDDAVLADLRETMAEILDVPPETITDHAHFINDLGVDPGNLTRARRCYAHHRLVGFDFDDFLVGRYLVAWLNFD